MYIAINNCDWQDAITNKYHPQPTVLADCSQQALWVETYSQPILWGRPNDCMQDVQGSNPPDG